MKQRDMGRHAMVYRMAALLLLWSIAMAQAQESSPGYQVRPGEPISAELKTLEIIYVLEADVNPKEATSALTLSAYPNPTTAQINITIGTQEAIKQVVFYTMAGTRTNVPQLRAAANSSTYDVALLPNGMYLVVVELEGGRRITKKIIKN
ncbi:hypothetical protein MTsPCn5_24750 [Croceitalea sp. MTPC5]|uniref:T9SS type A sorting domain-containing protein n=1 Tax=Croceitalea sp. MTPC5 TaxID=3056565 RepID=UPI002B38E32E|nr:hypothetical protein MTsPCn5_24750 [Croceitalea sp. MTPC5]